MYNKDLNYNFTFAVREEKLVMQFIRYDSASQTRFCAHANQGLIKNKFLVQSIVFKMLVRLKKTFKYSYKLRVKLRKSN